MNAVAQAVLAVLQLIAPGATADLIAKIIAALASLITFIAQEAKDLAPIVKNIIAALRGNGDITSEQLDQLDTMEAQLDADFDTSSAAADAEDAAAGDTSGDQPAAPAGDKL